MVAPRFFLVAPPAIAADHLVNCVKAASDAGDVASIVVDATLHGETVAVLQRLGIAVLARDQPHGTFDDIHLDATGGGLAAARSASPAGSIVGAFCGSSRHWAMEAAESGADYVALSQNAGILGEPIVGWWSQFFEIPCVAFDPVELADLDILLPQSPDFIRPGDGMWATPQDCHRLMAELTKRMLG